METKHKANCASCTHYDSKTKLCTNAGGLLREIELTAGLAEASHGCAAYEEARYRLTPASLLMLACKNNKVVVSLNKAALILDELMTFMVKHGYIEET